MLLNTKVILKNELRVLNMLGVVLLQFKISENMLVSEPFKTPLRSALQMLNFALA